MIACLGETTGTDALNRILEQMKNCDEGQRILKDKPRINSRDIDLESLEKMPEDTFGFHYKQFLNENVSRFFSRYQGFVTHLTHIVQDFI